MKKAVKKVNRQFKFSVKSRHFSQPGEESKQLNVFQDVVTNDCTLGTWFRVKDDQGKLIPGSERIGPIDLKNVSQIDEVEEKVEDLAGEPSLGFSLRFRPGGELLTFPSAADRTKFLKKLINLQSLCLKKEIKEINEAALQEEDQEPFCEEEKGLPNRDIALPEGFDFGFQEIYRRLGQENQDMEVALLKEKESFAERYLSASRAKKSIKVQTFIFTGDEAGIKLGELLIQKKKEGLDVQVLLDYFSAMIYVIHPIDRENTYRLFNNMMAAGIPVHGYACMGGVRHLLNELNLARKMGTPKHHRLSIHEKIWMTDGTQAIMGGININNAYLGANPSGKERWRDQDLAVKGKNLIQDLDNIFEGNLKTYQGNRTLPNDKKCFNPHPVGSPEYEAFLKKHTKEYQRSDVKSKSKRGQYAVKMLDELSAGIINGKPFTPQFLPVSEARVIHSWPDSGENHIEDAYIDLINKAQKEILLANAYFILTPAFIKALQDAAKRGVKIKTLANSSESNDFPPSVLAGRHYYQELVGSSYGTPHEIEIYEWDGVNKKTGKTVRGMLHSKFAVIDNQVSVLGSFNLDSASRDGNGEIVLVYKGKKTAAQLRRIFLKEDLKYANKVDYASMIKFRHPRGLKRVFKKMIYKWSHKHEHMF